jgi:hypothetical protein
LDGGYYGFYFYGGTGTGAYGTNIVFDSNTVSNQYYYGTYPYYIDYASCSYNTFLSRTGNVSTTWYALRLYYSNGPAIGNRIIQRSAAITYPYAMYVYYYNYYSTQDTGLIANNEIIAYTSTYDGMYVYYSLAKILHNSIYMSGSGASRGIYIGSTANDWYAIKNNNIVMNNTGGFPIYLSSTTYLSQYDIDNNNMYAPQYVGYAGGNKTTIGDWQQTVTTDTRSISANPTFIDNTTGLRLVNYSPFLTTPVGDVTHDITGLLRFGGITALGCYHGLTIYNVNATLTDLYGWREGSLTGQQDTVKVLLFNGGSTPLTSANIGCSHNNVALPPVSWSGNLAIGETDTVVLGVITHSASGIYTLSAWINNVGNLTDEFLDDDTLTISGLICAAPLHGTYTIGANGNFPNISEALRVMNLCSVDGDLVFEVETGTYNQNIELLNISSVLGNNTLTITSATHNAEDVVFVTNSVGVLLGNSKNIV